MKKILFCLLAFYTPVSIVIAHKFNLSKIVYIMI